MAEFDNYAEQYADLLKDPIRDRFAPGSQFFFKRKWELVEDYFSREGLNIATSSWLDVGCGAGQLLKLGLGRFARIAGCDISTGMLAACDKALGIVPQTDPAVLPFANEQFDFVTAVCVYHHVPPEGRAALTAELVRVLRPGGTACIIEHNPINPATRLIVSRTPVDENAILLTPFETARLLRSAGLQSTATNFFLYLPESLYRKMRWVETALSRVPVGGQYAVFARKKAQGQLQVSA